MGGTGGEGVHGPAVYGGLYGLHGRELYKPPQILGHLQCFVLCSSDHGYGGNTQIIADIVAGECVSHPPEDTSLTLDV